MHTIRGVWRDGLETQPFGDGAESALRFSVIITFYNQRDFVRTALDSALSQGVEVVAVDDGSTDGTRELLSEYRDRVRLVLLEENVGACAARNAGADAATGDYLAYLDGDDAFMPWALDTYRAVAESLAPALMMGPMRWFDEDEPPEPPGPPRHIRYIAYGDYFAKERIVDISVSAIVVRRDLLMSVGGFAGFPVDDLHLLYRLGAASPFLQITEPATTWHRAHAGQTIRHVGRPVKARPGRCRGSPAAYADTGRWGLSTTPRGPGLRPCS